MQKREKNIMYIICKKIFEIKTRSTNKNARNNENHICKNKGEEKKARKSPTALICKPSHQIANSLFSSASLSLPPSISPNEFCYTPWSFDKWLVYLSISISTLNTVELCVCVYTFLVSPLICEVFMNLLNYSLNTAVAEQIEEF